MSDAYKIKQAVDDALPDMESPMIWQIIALCERELIVRHEMSDPDGEEED